MKTQKGFAPLIIILGILVTVIIAGGIFYLGRVTTPKIQPQTSVVTSTPQPTSVPQATPSQSPDETSNWKTYTNNALGFSIKYPANILVTPLDESDAGLNSGLSGITMTIQNTQTGSGTQGFGGRIDIYLTSKQKLLEDKFKWSVLLGMKDGETKILTSNFDSTFKRLPDTVLDGAPAEVFESYKLSTFQAGVTERDLLIHKGSKLYSSYSIIDENDGSGVITRKLYNQILSTFKFTN